MLNERLNRLEERLIWMERHITEQDKVILAQGKELTLMRETLAKWVARTQETPEGDGLFSSEERPPHY